MYSHGMKPWSLVGTGEPSGPRRSPSDVVAYGLPPASTTLPLLSVLAGCPSGPITIGTGVIGCLVVVVVWGDGRSFEGCRNRYCPFLFVGSKVPLLSNGLPKS